MDDSVYISFEQTYVKKGNEEIEKSIRLPTIPTLHELVFTDKFDFQNNEISAIGDALSIGGDIFKKYLRNYEDAFALDDLIITELRERLTDDYRDQFILGEVFNSRLAERFEISYTSILDFNSQFEYGFAEEFSKTYNETFSINDSINYEI